MSELLTMYCIITYLFTMGITFAGWGNCQSSEKIGAIVCLILSPGSLPIILGVGYYNHN
jgi:hypothetical protein